MSKKKSTRILVMLMALALFTGGLSLESLADEKSFESQALEAAAEIPDELPKAKINVTADVTPGQEGFSQKGAVYQTFNKEDDPKEHLEDTVEVGGIKYKVVEAGAPREISSEDTAAAGVHYESELFAKDEQTDPDDEIEYDGIQLRLVSKEIREVERESRIEPQRKTITIENVEGAFEAPTTRQFEFEDHETGEKIYADLALESQEVTETHWTDEFTFPVKITGYDADEFDLNGTTVKKNEPLINYADAFLRMLNLDPECYEIQKIEWAGEEYRDADGALCRNAAASGRKLVRTIEAVYAGDVEIPAAPAYQWVCEYAVKTDPEKSTIYTMVADVELKRADLVDAAGDESNQQRGSIEATAAGSESGSLWDRIKGAISAAYEAVAGFINEHPAVSVVLLLAIAAFIALLLTRRAKDRCIYNRKIKCIHKGHTKEICEGCIHYYQAKKQA